MDAPPPQAPVEVHIRAAADTGADVPARVSARAAELALVEARLRGAIPATRIKSVEHSALPGFYLVRLADKRIAYTDRDAKFLVLGVVFDLTTGKVLDQQLDALTSQR